MLATHGYRVAPPATVVDHQARLLTTDEPTWHSDHTAVVRMLIPALAQALIAGAGIRRDVRGGRHAD
jgi:hypothetical protein